MWHLGEELPKGVGAAVQRALLLKRGTRDEELDGVLQPLPAAVRHLHDRLPCTALQRDPAARCSACMLAAHNCAQTKVHSVHVHTHDGNCKRLHDRMVFDVDAFRSQASGIFSGRCSHFSCLETAQFAQYMWTTPTQPRLYALDVAVVCSVR